MGKLCIIKTGSTSTRSLITSKSLAFALEFIFYLTMEEINEINFFKKRLI